MSSFLFWLAVVTFVFTLGIAAQVVLGFTRMKKLRDYPPAYGDLPRVSLVVAARNEERQVEQALLSLLRLDYEPLEITVIDDRSTDRTGEILERLARQHPRLNLVRISELPPGWLGKNHALHVGAARSSGEWLLFTDADIHFAPLALRRAIGYVRERGVDHLVLAPETTMPSWTLQSFVVTFAMMFHIFVKSWKVSDPRSKAHVGIGAFNLVRAAAYRAVGGHQPIAMRPDDDLKLGKILKDAGHRQQILNGLDLTRVEWYPSLGELVVGLEKNSFATLEYRPAATLAAVASVLTIHVWPFAAVLATTGPTRWLNLACVAIWLGLTLLSARALRASWTTIVLFPLAMLLFGYIMLRSMAITLRTGGIRWRDTFYPLAELRANRV